MKKTILIALLLVPFFGFSQANKLQVKETHQFNMMENPNSNENEFKQNLSTGIAYYNRAVTLIQKIDYDTDALTLEQITEQCKELFKISLPYLEKCYAQDPTHKNTLIALSGIYFSLNDMEKSKRFQKEQEVLKSK